MGEDATPQIVVKLPLDIGRQAGGLGVIRERGEKGLQVLRDHVVEHRAAGIPRCVGGHRWRHTRPHVQEGSKGSARKCHLIYCTNVHYTSKNVAPGMWWKHARRTALLRRPLYVVRAAGAK